MNMRDVGRVGERIALKYLRENGYTILETNYQGRAGEIDIIADRSDLLVFIEVKLRKSLKFGRGMEAVDKRKIEKIRNMAMGYIQEKNINVDVRFDVIDIYMRLPGDIQIDHIKNAF